jgi:ATP synthase protein I
VNERDGFEKRLRTARTRHSLDAAPGKQAGFSGAAGVGLRAGVEVVSALIVGAGIGWVLDWWLGTFPWIFLVFFLIGGAAGILNVYRLVTPRTRTQDPAAAGTKSGLKNGSSEGGGRRQDD